MTTRIRRAMTQASQAVYVSVVAFCIIGFSVSSIGAVTSGNRAGVQACGCSTMCCATGVASYEVLFTALWPTSSYQIPRNFPHWSQPIGASHSACAVVWRNGTISTDGIEVMAEVGTTSTLKSEMGSWGGNHLRDVINLGGVSGATGTSKSVFTVDRYHPLVSLVSMIAPSPDWFVGVDSVPLCNNSQWVESVTYNLLPWDSASDSGTTYNAGNADIPNGQIVRIRPDSTNLATDLYVSSSVTPSAMATFIFTRKSVDQSGSVTNVTCPTCRPIDTCHESYDVIVNTRQNGDTYSAPVSICGKGAIPPSSSNKLSASSMVLVSLLFHIFSFLSCV